MKSSSIPVNKPKNIFCILENLHLKVDMDYFSIKYIDNIKQEPEELIHIHREDYDEPGQTFKEEIQNYEEINCKQETCEHIRPKKQQLRGLLKQALAKQIK